MESEETPVSHISVGLTTPEKVNIRLVCFCFLTVYLEAKLYDIYEIYFKTVLSVCLMLYFYKLDMFYN